MSYLSPILVVAACALYACGGFLLVRDGSQVHQRVARRMEEFGYGETLAEPGLAATPRARAFAAGTGWLYRRLLLAQIAMPSRSLLIFIVGGLAAAAAGIVIYAPKSGAGFVIGLGALAAFYVNSRAAKNRRHFLQHLPVFIERLHQLLAAGNSLATAFDKALEYSDPIVCAYMRPVSVRLAHGATMADSLSLQGYRLDLPQLAALSVVAHANERFGGSLGEVLSRVAGILMDSSRVQKEFDAMTAEMRVSAKILVCLPVLVSVFVLATNPSYMMFFIDQPLGHVLAFIALGMSVLGTFVLHLMCRIES